LTVHRVDLIATSSQGCCQPSLRIVSKPSLYNLKPKDAEEVEVDSVAAENVGAVKDILD
jgi:hypothetical protein